MHPVLFQVGNFTIYTYGFCIAIGAILGFCYLWWQGRKQYQITFDQSNTLFIVLVIAGIVGGKLFVIFEDPRYYIAHPSALLSGSGFVFYGSLLTAIPVMLWFFKKNKLPTLGMLDIMAVVTCLVHGFGRIGCFNAGCCYGKPTASFTGVIFTNPTCEAPLNVALHPTQLYEAGTIFCILILLLISKSIKKFNGQMFLLYLMLYATGRGVLELFRGDTERGFIIKNILSNSQFISLIIIITAAIFYVKLNRKSKLSAVKP